MKHRHTRELYDYWSRMRGSDAAPRRGAIEPADIRSLLGDTFILESAAAARYPFRLAGTRLCAHYGRELKGRNFLSLWDDSDMEAVATLLTAVTVDAAAAVLGVETFNDRGQSAPFEMVVLPLSRGGRVYDRILGLMVAIERPYWLDLHPVIGQKVTSLRLIWPEETRSFARDESGSAFDATTLPAIPPAALLAGRRRQHLVVLDGGKR